MNLLAIAQDRIIRPGSLTRRAGSAATLQTMHHAVTIARRPIRSSAEYREIPGRVASHQHVGEHKTARVLHSWLVHLSFLGLGLGCERGAAPRLRPQRLRSLQATTPAQTRNAMVTIVQKIVRVAWFRFTLI
jgi:hypothetical protein